MLLTFLALAGIGFSAGMLGAMLGLGGGIFLVPALTLLFGLPIRVAVGASLIGVIATSAGVASVSRPGRSADVGLALRLEIATTDRCLVGRSLGRLLSSAALSVIFAGIVMATAFYTYTKARRQPEPVGEAAVTALFQTDYRPRHWPLGLAFSCIAGALSGLTGVGGGFIKVPVMYSVMDVPLGVATASSNFMVGITAATSVLLYYNRGDIYPQVAVPTALGVFVGAVSGARLASRIRVATLRKALIVLLVLVAIQMAWQGLHGG